MRPRIGVVGLKHGHSLARSVAACPSLELAALCARNLSEHRDKARELNTPLFDHIDTMLSALQLNGVVIAAPTSQLVSIAKKCLAQHVSVLVEKPLAIDVAQALELKAAAAQSHAHVVVGYYRRLARQVVALKELLASKVIGDVTGVSCKWVIRKPRGYFQGWKASRAMGGGCLMINVIHDLDLLQQLLGPIETVAALASHGETAGDVEHCVAVSMKFSGGQTGSAFFSDQSPSPYAYDHSVAAISKFPQYAVDAHHFFGTNGSLAFPSFTVWSHSAPDQSWLDSLSSSIGSRANEATDDPITRQIERFAKVLNGSAQPHATIDDAIQNLSVIEAIRRSLDLSTIERVYSAPCSKRLASSVARQGRQHPSCPR
jgi:predicted dehydrogenase